MNNIVDMFKEYKEKELKEYAEKQFQALQKASSRIKELESEIGHLQEMLGSTIPIIQKIILTPEQALIENQIKILEETYRGEKHMSLEDTKRLDLLIKNKKLLNEIANTLPGESRNIPNEISHDDLVALAKSENDGKL